MDNPATRDDEEPTKGPVDSSGLDAEPFPEEPEVSLDDPDYANKVLGRAVRQATQITTAEQNRQLRPDSSWSQAPQSRSIFRSYSRLVRKDLGWSANWLPTSKLEPGDIGVISDGIFMRLSHISEMGNLSLEQTTSSSRVNVSLSGPGSVRFGLQEENDSYVKDDGEASNAPPRVEVRMRGENTVLAIWKDATVNSIADRLTVFRSVVELVDKGEWSRELVLVTDVMQADSGVILISDADEASIQFRITLPGDATHSGELNSISVLSDSTLEVVHTSGMAMTFVLRDKFTPCFRASRVRKGFLGGSTKLVEVDV